MNMKSNIPKQPTLGNQQDTPDQDYAIGDVVVIMHHCASNSLHEVIGPINENTIGVAAINHVMGCVMVDYRKLVAPKFLRAATTAELKAKRRLSETEQSLAEVS
ncbi:hypothetical protein RFH42_01920 [Acinetobacter rudis]|uniref:hypothetical protein n=1 Tax=Acinetobacter rudis TaxID=632955 RepID=UPI00280EBBEE|nr:hypothetical protein [Acinetobacter rudis]MDQ8951716.1 hypothetical protein [Acinetobacter rudis]